MADANLVQQIRQRAYDIWLSEGPLHGRDRIHWLRAEAELQEKLSPVQSQSPSSKPLPEQPAASGRSRRQTGRRKQEAGRKGSKG